MAAHLISIIVGIPLKGFGVVRQIPYSDGEYCRRSKCPELGLTPGLWGLPCNICGRCRASHRESGLSRVWGSDRGYGRSVASHHGRIRTAVTMKPGSQRRTRSYVVFSAGTRFGHPRREIVERYQEVQETMVATHRLRWGLNNMEYHDDLTTQKPVYVTKANGAIVMRTNGRMWQVECSLESGCY